MGISWPKSGSLELDNNAQPATGAKAYFFTGGTTTPLTTYEDGDESTPHEHPLEADGNGRWPLVVIPFVASYDVKVVTEGGTQLYYHQELPNPDPVEDVADAVADEDLVQTGHVWWEPINTTKVGAVRLNARTIGNAASGATERANADTSDLFTYLWNNVANAQCAVSSGRGGSAAADYAANKTITLLDGRSGTLQGLDDMGGSAAGRLGSAPFANGNATTAGSVLGANTHTILEAHLPAHTHTFSATSSSDGAHTHTGTVDSDGAHTHTADHNHSLLGVTGTVPAGTALFATINQGSGFGSGSGFGNTETASVTTSSGGAHTHTFTSASNGAHTHTVSGTTSSVGSGTAHNIVSYGLLGTFYQKL